MLVALATAAAALSAAAQTGTPETIDLSIAGAARDIKPRYVVPESPAFSFLSASPAKITRPASAKDLAAALTNAIDAKGHLQQGLALEAAYTRLVADTISLSTYQTTWYHYALANTRLSFSSVRVTSDTASTDAAGGVRTTLVDRSDPLASLALTNALAAALPACLTEHPVSVPGQLAFFRGNTAVPLEAALRRVDSTRAASTDSVRRAKALTDARACAVHVADSLKRDFVARHWNDVSLAVAAAQGWRLDKSSVSTGRNLGYRLYATASLPVGRLAQLIWYGDWTRATARDTTPAYSAAGYGGRLVVGSPEFNFFAERRREVRSRSGQGIVKSIDPWAGGIEFRIANQLWLSSGLGRNAERDGTPKNGTVLLADLRWGLSDTPRVGR